MKKGFFSVLKIIYPSLGATSAMTLFSYAATYLANDQFKEPKLLSYFFFTPEKRKENEPPIGGFLLHYLVGVGFSAAYQYIWKRFFNLTEWKDGLSYGALCSIIGMLTWKITFATHPSPPNIKLKSYLFHLFVAHLIFGVTLSKFDKKIRTNSSPQKSADKASTNDLYDEVLM